MKEFLFTASVGIGLVGVLVLGGPSEKPNAATTTPNATQTRSAPIRVAPSSKTYNSTPGADTSWFSTTVYLQILAVDDLVEVNDVILNRGNCESNSYLDFYEYSKTKLSDEWEPTSKEIANINPITKWRKRRPIVLKFGQSKEISTSCTQILEVTVKTNLGDFSFGGAQ
jgi:hypothetical protein